VAITTGYFIYIRLYSPIYMADRNTECGIDAKLLSYADSRLYKQTTALAVVFPVNSDFVTTEMSVGLLVLLVCPSVYRQINNFNAFVQGI